MKANLNFKEKAYELDGKNLVLWIRVKIEKFYFVLFSLLGNTYVLGTNIKWNTLISYFKNIEQFSINTYTLKAWPKNK